MGNSFALAWMTISTFPSVVILTEFAVQLPDRAAELNLEWVTRDQNEEADALTNEEFGAFWEKDGNREEVIDKFRGHFEASGLRARVGELRGSVLACHCTPCQACHADVLV